MMLPVWFNNKWKEYKYPFVKFTMKWWSESIIGSYAFVYYSSHRDIIGSRSRKPFIQLKLNFDNHIDIV